jgi:ankyrin repeat protein
MRARCSTFICNCFSTIPRRVAGALLALALVSVTYYCINKEVGSLRIHDAVIRGDLAKIRSLLRNDSTLVFSKDNKGETPLFDAPNKATAELLLDNGADVNARDRRLFTPLHVAAGGFTNRKDVVAVLLAHGAQVNARDDLGMTPLYLMAFVPSQTPKMELLLDHGADANAAANDGMTPLHEAAAGGNKDEVELLLAKGADANGRYRYAWTPARLAANNNHPEVAAILHHHGGW